MKESLQEILNEAKRRLEEATSLKDAEDVRIKVLGKKGDLTSILKSMGGLSPEERKQLGMEANTVKAQIEQMLKNTQEQLKIQGGEDRRHGAGKGIPPWNRAPCDHYHK